MSDLAIPPGELLGEEIAAAGLTEPDFAAQLETSLATLAGILEGRLPITPEVAARIEDVLGSPARLWLGLEERYQATLAAVSADSTT